VLYVHDMTNYLLFRLSSKLEPYSLFTFSKTSQADSCLHRTLNLIKKTLTAESFMHCMYPTINLPYIPSLHLHSLGLTFPSPPSTCVLPPHFPPLHISLLPPTHIHSQCLRDWHMVVFILFLTGISAVILIFMEGFDMYIASPVRDPNSVSIRNVS